ncbi:MAG TPA: hypothetical protein VHL32_09145 [Gemmatimonadaceae bacterium]|nr:hypothetical protein [Gemmatimonadaceae bacterium]
MKRQARVVLIATTLMVGACATATPGARSAARSRVPEGGPGCLDTLHASDSVTRIVTLSVSSRDTSVKLPRDFENLFAEEFRSRFRAPEKTPLSVVKGVPPCDPIGSRCAAGVLDIGAVVYATAQNNGKLRDVEVLDIALVPAFADTVMSVLAAISREALAPPTGEVDEIPLILELRSEVQPDSVPRYRQIFKVKLPVYELPFRYAAMPAAGIDASYPFTARLTGVGDTVSVAFTVAADGLIRPESLELVRANYRDFVTPVANALLQTRYHPARLGDCAVATRMEQRFVFKPAD